MLRFLLLFPASLLCGSPSAQAGHWPPLVIAPSYIAPAYYHAAPLVYAQPNYVQPSFIQPNYLTPAATLYAAPQPFAVQPTAHLLWLSATPTIAPSFTVPPNAVVPATDPNVALRQLTAQLETLTRTVSALTTAADDHEARLRRLETWARDAKQTVPLPK